MRPENSQTSLEGSNDGRGVYIDVAGVLRGDAPSETAPNGRVCDALGLRVDAFEPNG